jgi:hypothetical protein
VREVAVRLEALRERVAERQVVEGWAIVGARPAGEDEGGGDRDREEQALHGDLLFGRS